MKRSAIEIIIAISCAGKPKRLKGLRRSSIANVKSKGLVEAVNIVVTMIINNKRTVIYNVLKIASL